MFKIFELKRFVTLFSIILIGAVILGIFGIRSGAVYTSTGQKEEQYTVYLTFDDGPSAVTSDLLNVLESENVKATFFVIGSTTENGVNLYNRIIDGGHALGLHTFSHNAPSIYSSSEIFMTDFEKLSDWIFTCTNTTPKIYRFPGGSKTIHCTEKVMTDIQNDLSKEGYVMYDWNVQANDSSDFTLPVSDLIRNVINGAEQKPNQDLVILFHDDSLRTSLPSAMPEIIQYFKDKGYVFDVLTENTILK